MQLALHFEKDAKPGKEETHNRSQYIFTIFFTLSQKFMM